MPVRPVSTRRHRGLMFAVALALAGGVGLSASAARAATASYSYFYTAATTGYSAPAGSSLTVKIYLEEEANSTTVAPSLIDEDLGLFTGAFSITGASESASPSTITGVAANQGVEPVAFSNVNAQGLVGGVYTVSEIADINALVDVLTQPVPAAGFATAVLLGSVTIHVGAAGSVTTFTPTAADGTGTTNYNLDDGLADPALYNAAAPTPFTVTALAAVPEPATVGVVAAGVLAIASRRRRA